MCGLVGYSGKKPFDLKCIELLIAWNSMERGEDATGLFSPKNGIKKSLTKGSHFVLFKDNQIIKDNYFIGHVRAGTVGNKTDVKNAHPFDRGNFILAHNGTLTNHYDLLEKYNLARADYDVDSDILTGCMAEANEIVTPIKEISGAAALLIHDKREPNVLNVYRKSGQPYQERPLFRGIDKNGNMYISSLAEPLHFIGLFNVKPFKEDTLYTIIDGEITSAHKIKSTPYSKPVTTNYYNRHTPLNYSRTAASVDLDDNWKDLNVRCKHPISISYADKCPTLNLEAGKYYLSRKTNPNNVRNIIIFVNNTEYNISKTFFCFEDIIYKDDLIKLNNDIFDQSTGEIEALKGDIQVVDGIWRGDGEVRSINLKTTKVLRYINKSNFIKLTQEEKAEVYKANQLALFNTNTANNGITCEEITQDTFTNPTKSSQDTNKSDDTNRIMVSYMELDSTFHTLDDKLESLRDKIKKGADRNELIEETTKLIDNIFTARSLFLEPNIT